MRIKIGITGHQRLSDPSAWSWVESALNQVLDPVKAPVTALSSLAIGADQLFATIVLRRGGKIHAVIPFQDYERTFDRRDLDAYRCILKRATAVEILETYGTDEDKYWCAGKRIVDLADLMIAVWDGNPAKGKGGTADVAAYAIQRGIRMIHVNTTNRRVTER